MDALSLLAHLMFKTFFLALPVGVAWLAFRRLSMSESRNAWLYSAVGLFASLSAASLAPWALGFAATSWVVLLIALLCPLIWISTVVVCDIRQRSYGDDDATDWVIERFTSRQPLPADNPAAAPLVLQTPAVATDGASSEPVVPVFRHTPAVETATAPTSVDTPTPVLLEPVAEEPDVTVIAETPEPLEEIARQLEAEAPAPVVPAETPHPEIVPIASSTAVEKNQFLGKEVEAPRHNDTRRVLDVARDMRGDGVSHERLMRSSRNPSRKMAALGGTA